MKRGTSKIWALTAATIAVGMATVPSTAMAKNAYEKQLEKIRAALDTTFEMAMKPGSGMAIVVIPTIHLDRKYKGVTSNDLVYRVEKEFTADRSFTLLWSRNDNPQKPFLTGNLRTLEDVGTQKGVGVEGSFFQFANPDSYILYQIYVVFPGTYDLVGHMAEIHETRAPETGPAAANPQTTIGNLILKQGESTKYYTEIEWRDRETRTVQQTDSYCQSVYVHGGGCAYWGKTSWSQQVETRAAGNYEIPKTVMMESVNVEHKLARPFASFTVAPSEAIIIDGFFGEYPNTGLQADACKRAAFHEVHCPITSYSLSKLQGSIDEFRRFNFNQVLLPKLGNIAATQMTYRATETHAAPLNRDARWGEIFTMGEVR